MVFTENEIRLPFGISLKNVQYEYIYATLVKNGWHRGITAEELQICPRNLRYKIVNMEIEGYNIIDSKTKEK